jgi:aminoglycoside/choline kinase family phosphotransferase
MNDPVIEERVRRAVSRATGQDQGAAPVRRLAGHASARSYWRVGTPPGSRVVMVMPPDAKPEEVTKGGRPAVDPFVDVQRYLSGLGVRVPAIAAFYEDDPRGGLMVLEDLGDEMLETRLLAGDDARALYEVAVDQLARLRAAAERAPGGSIAFTRSFDRDLYRWELDHFREWLLEAWKGARLSPGERALVDREFDRIAAALEAEPKGFTHRDYQSRNLMVLPGGAQAVIDFQDALLGPRQYDLVALLRDSYVELPAELVDDLLRRYLDRLHEAGGPRLAYGSFRELFDLLTVQRKLKDAGRFVFIDRVKRNPGFLVSIPASLRYVRDAFARRPDLRPLQEVLARHVPELAA